MTPNIRPKSIKAPVGSPISGIIGERICLTDPSAIKTNENPIAVANASVVATKTVSRDALCSIRPRIMQLVTMICTNKAMRTYTSHSSASMVNIATVVKVAITSTKKGNRTFAGINFRIIDMSIAELTSTNVLAMLKPTAFSIVLLTASKGQRPSS